MMLSTELNNPAAIPYFLWDEPMTVAEFKQRLKTASLPEQRRLLAKLLREARDTDVWLFTTPQEVWQRWNELSPMLGRRRAFWESLFQRWQNEGLLERHPSHFASDNFSEGEATNMAKRKNADAIATFHRDALKTMLRFIADREITNLDGLNAVDGRKLLDEPLWKLLETDGKYGGDLISEGVKSIEDNLRCKVRASTGTWPEKDLQHWLGNPPDGRLWGKDDSYCCHLEHVVERAQIIQMLFSEPGRIDEILDRFLIGCVILRSEHHRLKSVAFDPHDSWNRYRKAGIKVWSRTRNDWVI